MAQAPAKPLISDLSWHRYWEEINGMVGESSGNPQPQPISAFTFFLAGFLATDDGILSVIPDSPFDDERILLQGRH